MLNRCSWCSDDPHYIDYHDNEWGVPLYDERKLFEMLILEGAQAGLSWLTILKKRENYRRAFNQFDPEIIASYTNQDIERLMQDAGIVRNRRKIEATIRNARGYMKIREDLGSFSDYLWSYVAGQPVINRWRNTGEIPVQTAASKAMSASLKEHGFNFVGPTICYAFMQAVGMVNDHTTDCFRYKKLA